jgi:hypothetical protein
MRKRQITVELTDPLLSVLDKILSDLQRSNQDTSLEGYIVACLVSLHEDDMLPFPDYINTEELSRLIHHESEMLSKEAKAEFHKGNLTQSRSNYLRAASLELESMCYSKEILPNEEISRLITLLHLIKLGLGYRSLPVV